MQSHIHSFLSLSLVVLLAFSVQDPDPGRLVIVEVKRGERMRDLEARLRKQGLAAPGAVEDYAATAVFPGSNVIPPPVRDPARFEGIFKPGTYAVKIARKRDPVPAILAHVIERSLPRYGSEAANGLDPSRLVILASIVEKEAAGGNDLDRVAAVFLNRLSAGLRLSSCPALEYALGYHRPFLTKEDLAADSPYNLYLHPGLPPTPIGFFSDAALGAVTASPPREGRDLFFVFDWINRKLLFAKTFAEHEKNVAAARRNYAGARGPSSLYRKQPGVYYEDVSLSPPPAPPVAQPPPN